MSLLVEKDNIISQLKEKVQAFLTENRKRDQKDIERESSKDKGISLNVKLMNPNEQLKKELENQKKICLE